LAGRKPLARSVGDRVGENFFETTGIAILRGRGFSRGDIAGNRRTMVVNETMAQRLWPSQDPIGQQIDFGGQAHEVIGIAKDIRPAVPMGASQPAAYQPVRPSDYSVPSRYGITILIRVQPGFDAGSRLRDEVENLDRRLTVFNLRSMDDIAREALFFAHLAVNIYGAMGVFAMVLACTGLAGVTAYSVARRAREIGIRKALGAPDRHVYGLVLSESAYMIGIGGILGLALALGTMRALSSVMNVLAEATKTSTSDPVLIVGAPLLLVSISLLVCYLPARRATEIDPASSLRSE
jgi:hypothetical protein